MKLSALVGIAALIEQQSLWGVISNPYDTNKNGILNYPACTPNTRGDYPPMGPGPTVNYRDYDSWATEIPKFAMSERSRCRAAGDGTHQLCV